ncbi:MAG TPA: hypothetical protein PLH82_02100 [Candidatus Paceibacterota bacterium]|nr:hypothetical protein [Candidatus Paceibacterota bacterium]
MNELSPDVKIGRWNREKGEYDEYVPDPKWKIVLYSDDIEEPINCASCGDVITIGEGFTSIEIHNLPLGFGYPVCERCHFRELKKMKNKNSQAFKRGQYYKVKTKKHFEKLGYITEYLEKYRSIYTPRGIIRTKQDLFGSDGLSMNSKELIFWNSKFSSDKSSEKTAISKAKKEFSKYQFPKSNEIKKVIVLWKLRQKPIIMSVDNS